MNLQEPINDLVSNDSIEHTDKESKIEDTSIVMPFMETSWTPRVRGSNVAGTINLGLARGQCYSVGRHRFILIHLTVASITGNPTGNLQVTGIPFTPVYGTPLTLGITSFMSLNLSNRYVTPVIHPNGVIDFMSNGSGAEVGVNINSLHQFATIQLAGSFISSI